MKLIVTVPAYNEEKSIIEVVRSVPRKIKGIDFVQVLVYDDGSTDHTAVSAKKAGADYVYTHKRNRGLARTFKDALDAALELGADVVVNTDADNQYDQAEIPKLLAPILNGTADLVIGDRQVATLGHMPTGKKYGNMLGSAFIRWFTGMKVRDASSGFRAHTRECAQHLSIVSEHTYTHETLIDAFFKGMVIVDVPVVFRKRTSGQSRLIARGVMNHIVKSVATIIRTVLLYRALYVLSVIGSIIGAIGLGGIIRYLYFALIEGDAGGHVQSLVISSVLIGTGINIIFLGFIADLLAYNRRLIENTTSRSSS